MSARSAPRSASRSARRQPGSAPSTSSQAKQALGGDLTRIKRCVKVQGFVNCAPDFGDHPKVVNGASDLLVLALGEAGKHARFAVGAPSLPFDSSVEVDAVFEVA